MKMEAAPEHNNYKRILILQSIIAIILIFLAIGAIVTTVQYSRLFQQLAKDHEGIEEDLEKIREEQREAEKTICMRLDKITEELSLLKEGSENTQEMLMVQLRAISRMGGQVRGGEIIGMIAEKLIYDYIQRALQYFMDADYGNAYATFSLALRYQENNSTLQFYQIYSLYLGQKNAKLTELELTAIDKGIREIKERGFKENEQLEFSIEEMENKMIEIKYNIDILRQQWDGDVYEDDNAYEENRVYEEVNDYEEE